MEKVPPVAQVFIWGFGALLTSRNTSDIQWGTSDFWQQSLVVKKRAAEKWELVYIKVRIPQFFSFYLYFLYSFKNAYIIKH